MKVKELIIELQKCDQESQVIILSPNDDSSWTAILLIDDDTQKEIEL